MSKYLMNKFIHHVNMNESAGLCRKVGEGREVKVYVRGAGSALRQGLRQALRPGRSSVYALEFHGSRLVARETS